MADYGDNGLAAFNDARSRGWSGSVTLADLERLSAGNPILQGIKAVWPDAPQQAPRSSVDWLRQYLPKGMGDYLGDREAQALQPTSGREIAGDLITSGMNVMPAGRMPVSVTKRPLPYGDVWFKHAQGGHLAASHDGGFLQVNDVLVPQNLRGNGYGVDLYQAAHDYAKSNGLQLASESRVSTDAAHVYDALARRGYTVERNPLASINNEGTEWGFQKPLTYDQPQWVFSVKDGPSVGATPPVADGRFK